MPPQVPKRRTRYPKSLVRIISAARLLYRSITRPRPRIDRNLDRSPSDRHAGSTSARVLVTISPDLIDNFGHYYHFDRQLLGVANSQHLSGIILASNRCKQEIISADPSVVPCFSDTTAVLATGGSLRTAVFQRELTTAIDSIRRTYPKAEILLFMYCGSTPSAKAISRVVESRPGITATILLFYDTFPQHFWNRTRVPLRITPESLSSSITLLAATPRHSARLRQEHAIEAPVLPCASTTFSDADIAGVLQERQNTCHAARPMRIAIPTLLHAAKGADLVYQLIRLLGQSPLARRCDLHIRAAGQEFDEARLAESVGSFAASVCVHRGTLSEADYRNLVSTPDIIVLPYRAADFACRPSGVFSDATALGIPIVVAAGTWMADVVMRNGSGATFIDNDAEALLDALENVVTNHARMSQAALNAGEAWRDQQSWQATLHVIDARTTDTGSRHAEQVD
jgi:hypothetical protein